MKKDGHRKFKEVFNTKVEESCHQGKDFFSHKSLNCKEDNPRHT